MGRGDHWKLRFDERGRVLLPNPSAAQRWVKFITFIIQKPGLRELMIGGRHFTERRAISSSLSHVFFGRIEDQLGRGRISNPDTVEDFDPWGKGLLVDPSFPQKGAWALSEYGPWQREEQEE